MSPHLLEDLYHQWGQPAWFWPGVMGVMLLLFVLGSADCVGGQP